MSMLSLPEALKLVDKHTKDVFSEAWKNANKELRLHLLQRIANAEFTCPRCRQASGQECKMMLFGRWRTGFLAWPYVHKERVVAALTVYGD